VIVVSEERCIRGERCRGSGGGEGGGGGGGGGELAFWVRVCSSLYNVSDYSV